MEHRPAPAPHVVTMDYLNSKFIPIAAKALHFLHF